MPNLEERRELGKLGAMDKVLLDQIIADVARLLDLKEVLNYIWIGKVGDKEYRIRATMYEPKKLDNDL